MKPFATLGMLLLFSGMAMAKDATAQIKVTGMTCSACSVRFFR